MVKLGKLVADIISIPVDTVKDVMDLSSGDGASNLKERFEKIYEDIADEY